MFPIGNMQDHSNDAGGTSRCNLRGKESSSHGRTRLSSSSSRDPLRSTLNVLSHNVQSVACKNYLDTERLRTIIHQYRSQSIICLQATGVNNWASQPMQDRSIPAMNDFHLLVPGTGPSPSSPGKWRILHWGQRAKDGTGVMIAIGPKLAHLVCSIISPQTELQGRGGGVRIRTAARTKWAAAKDLLIVNTYYPQHRERGGSSNHKTATSLTKWVSATLTEQQQRHCRTTPLWMGDFNAHFSEHGLTEIGTANKNFLVDKDDFNASLIRPVLRSLGLVAANTHWKEHGGRGWTYRGLKGAGSFTHSRIDYICIPAELLHSVSKCRVRYVQASRLQLSSGPEFLDHAGIHLEMHYELQVKKGGSPRQWNNIALSQWQMDLGKPASERLPITRKICAELAAIEPPTVPKLVCPMGAHTALLQKIWDEYSASLSGIMEKHFLLPKRAHVESTDIFCHEQREARMAIFDEFRDGTLFSKALFTLWFLLLEAWYGRQNLVRTGPWDNRPIGERRRREKKVPGLLLIRRLIFRVWRLHTKNNVATRQWNYTTSAQKKRRKEEAVQDLWLEIDKPKMDTRRCWQLCRTIAGPRSAGKKRAMSSRLLLDADAWIKGLAPFAEPTPLPSISPGGWIEQADFVRSGIGITHTKLLSLLQKQAKRPKAVPSWALPAGASAGILQVQRHGDFITNFLRHCQQLQFNVWQLAAGELAPIPKPNGKPGTDGIRTIYLLEPLSKAIGAHLADLLPPDPYEYDMVAHGFKSGHRREEAVAIAITMRERMRRKGLSSISSFMDVKQAFPAMSWKIFDVLRNQAAEDSSEHMVIQAVENLHKQQHLWIGSCSLLLRLTRGTQQGGPLGPRLFRKAYAIPINDYTTAQRARRTEENRIDLLAGTMAVGDLVITVSTSHLLYADDFMNMEGALLKERGQLVARAAFAETSFQTCLEKWEWESVLEKEQHLVDFRGAGLKALLPRTVTDSGEAIFPGVEESIKGKIRKDVAYLGIQVSRSGNFTAEIAARVCSVRKAWAGFGSMLSTGTVPFAWKKTIFRALIFESGVRSIYVLPIPESGVVVILRLIMKLGRTVVASTFGSQRAVSNENIRCQLGLPRLDVLLSTRRLMWLHGLIRFESDHLQFWTALRGGMSWDDPRHWKNLSELGPPVPSDASRAASQAPPWLLAAFWRDLTLFAKAIGIQSTLQKWADWQDIAAMLEHFSSSSLYELLISAAPVEAAAPEDATEEEDVHVIQCDQCEFTARSNSLQTAKMRLNGHKKSKHFKKSDSGCGEWGSKIPLSSRTCPYCDTEFTTRKLAVQHLTRSEGNCKGKPAKSKEKWLEE